MSVEAERLTLQGTNIRSARKLRTLTEIEELSSVMVCEVSRLRVAAHSGFPCGHQMKVGKA